MKKNRKRHLMLTSGLHCAYKSMCQLAHAYGPIHTHTHTQRWQGHQLTGRVPVASLYEALSSSLRIKKKKRNRLATMYQKQRQICKSEASLTYTVNSRPVRAT